MQYISIILIGLFLVSCGKDDSESDGDASLEKAKYHSLTVYKSENLPECTPEAEGWLIYIRMTQEFKTCLVNQWYDVNLKGEKGDPGPQGEQGEVGPAGPPGDTTPIPVDATRLTNVLGIVEVGDTIESVSYEAKNYILNHGELMMNETTYEYKISRYNAEKACNWDYYFNFTFSKADDTITHTYNGCP